MSDDRFTCSGCGEPSGYKDSVVILKGYIQTTPTERLDGHRYCRACAPLGRGNNE